MTPTPSEVAAWVETVSEALPAVDLESRLALSCLVKELTRARTEVDWFRQRRLVVVRSAEES